MQPRHRLETELRRWGWVGHLSFVETGPSQVWRCLDKDENSHRATAGQPGIRGLGPPRWGHDSHFLCPPSPSVPKTVVCTWEEAKKSFCVCTYLIPFNTKYVGVVTPLRDTKPGLDMCRVCPQHTEVECGHFAVSHSLESCKQTGGLNGVLQPPDPPSRITGHLCFTFHLTKKDLEEET